MIVASYGMHVLHVCPVVLTIERKDRAMDYTLDRPYVVQILSHGKNIGRVTFRTRADAEAYKELIYPKDGSRHYIDGECISAFVFVHEAAFLVGAY